MKHSKPWVIFTLAVASLAVVIFPSAAEAAVRARIPLLIQTLPSVSGIAYSIDGRRFSSDENGLAHVTVPRPGSYTLEIESRNHNAPERRLSFACWSDGSCEGRRAVAIESFTFLQAGFDSSFPVRPKFVDQGGSSIDPSRVQALALVDKLGNRHTHDGGNGQWLLGLRATSTTSSKTGLSNEKVLYRVQRARVDGINVSASARGPLNPALGVDWSIVLILPRFSLTVRVEDAFLNSPLGSSVLLHRPDGGVEQHVVAPGGTLEIDSLAMGNYAITPQGAGFGFTRPISLSASRDIRVAMLSSFDLAVIAALVALLLLGLLIIRRPVLVRGVLEDGTRVPIEAIRAKSRPQAEDPD